MDKSKFNGEMRGEMQNFEGQFERATDAREFVAVMNEWMRSDEIRTSQVGFDLIGAMVDRGLEKYGGRAFYDAFADECPDIVGDFLLPPKE